MIETLHLDVEGGVGERRTTRGPPMAHIDSVPYEDHSFVHPQLVSGASSSRANAAIHITLDGDPMNNHTNADAARVGSDESNRITSPSNLKGSPSTTSSKEAKPKKRVAFHTDRPDLYDF